MNPIGRRSLLSGAAVAIVMPLVAGGPGHAQAPRRLTPPATPLRYTRRLERELAGGASLVVTRSFTVRFVPAPDGFRVEGEQVAVEVEAPPQLETLARLERERVETALFPLHLDTSGTIRGIAGATDSVQLDAAVREAAAQIERWQHSPAERDELRAFVDAVHRSSAELITELPHDLFAPGDTTREEGREITLPDGTTGRVRVSFSARPDPMTGLMQEARREIVTELAGETRRTVESWILTPIA